MCHNITKDSKIKNIYSYKNKFIITYDKEIFYLSFEVEIQKYIIKKIYYEVNIDIDVLSFQSNLFIIKSKNNKLYHLKPFHFDNDFLLSCIEFNADINIKNRYIKDRNIRKICSCSTYTAILIDNGDLYVYGCNLPQSDIITYKDSTYPVLHSRKSNIYNMWSTQSNIVILKYDNSLRYLGKSKSTIYDRNITFISDSTIDLSWNIINHKLFLTKFNICVKFLYLSLKFYNNKYKIKIPKYVIYIIINYMT